MNWIYCHYPSSGNTYPSGRVYPSYCAPWATYLVWTLNRKYGIAQRLRLIQYWS